MKKPQYWNKPSLISVPVHRLAMLHELEAWYGIEARMLIADYGIQALAMRHRFARGLRVMTGRQRQIAWGIIDGLNGPDIADRVGVTPAAVYQQWTTVAQILECRSVEEMRCIYGFLRVAIPTKREREEIENFEYSRSNDR